MKGLLLAALAEAGLITWRDLSTDKIVPLPSDYVAVVIFYGGLGLLPESASGFTTLLGWGMVVATFMGLFDPTHPTKLALPGGKSTSSSPPVASPTQGQLNPAGTPLGGQFATAPPYTGTNFQ